MQARRPERLVVTTWALGLESLGLCLGSCLASQPRDRELMPVVGQLLMLMPLVLGLIGLCLTSWLRCYYECPQCRQLCRRSPLLMSFRAEEGDPIRCHCKTCKKHWDTGTIWEDGAV